LSETEALDDRESEDDDQISGLISKIEQKKKSLKAIIAKPKNPTHKIPKKMTKQVFGVNVINETGEAKISSVLNKIKSASHYRNIKSSKGKSAGLKGSDKAQGDEDRKINDLMNQVKQAKARKAKALKKKLNKAKARKAKALKKKLNKAKARKAKALKKKLNKAKARKAQEDEDRKIKDLMNQVKQVKARKEKFNKENVIKAKARKAKARQEKVNKAKARKAREDEDKKIKD
jgi:hypothetical protein